MAFSNKEVSMDVFEKICIKLGSGVVVIVEYKYEREDL